MTTTNLNLKRQFNTLRRIVHTRPSRPPARWLVLVTSGFALLVLAKIVLVASQIFAILNETYSASLT
jgi:hypothetical protein